jgi:hypothetical protein
MIGFCASILLWLFFERLWIGYVIGAPLALIGALLVWKQHNRDKVLSCFLASTLAVSPNVLADFSAGYSGQDCYCFTPAVETPEPEQHAVVLSFIIENGEPRILGMRHPTELVDYAGLNESLAAWGINLDGGLQYSKNGLPASEWEVPFSFGDWSNPLSIFPEREQFGVVLEQASELGNEFTYWQPVARFSVPADVRVEVQDSPEGAQCFYRVRLERAPEAFQPQGAVLLGCGLGLLAGTAFIGVLAVRACARNKKKFEKVLPPKKTNDLDQAQE